MARGEARGRTALIEWLELMPGKRVLDLACGPGTLSYRLAQAVSPDGDLVGIDLAPGMIEVAQRHAPAGLPLRFELMDIEDLRFPDGCFDAAACGHGLQFAPDLARALGEAHRVLKPGSRLAASVPVNPLQVSPAAAILERSVAADLPPAPTARDQFATRQTVEDERAFVTVTRQAGFSTARLERYEEATTWATPRHFIEMAAGWWSMATRLDGIAVADRAAILTRAAGAIERELGPGPLQIAGATNVLLAIA